MDKNIIDECSKLSLAGNITFLEVIKRLTTIGIERYIVDLVGKKKLTYNSNGKIYESLFKFDGPEVVSQFNLVKVRDAISNIQQQKISYKTFLHHIMEAGCCHYEVLINGRKAIYFGREGNYHIEDFPGQP